MTTKNSDRFITLALCFGTLVASLVVFAALASRFTLYTMDDSYIVFRYSENFAAGHGLVFNPGEYPRAEGITSPLYAIVLSLAPLSRVDIVIAAKWLGAAASVLTSFLITAVIYTILRSLTSLDRASAMLIGSTGLAYLLTNPYVAGNAVSGMETSLGALAFATFLLLIIKMMMSDRLPTIGHVLLLGLVATLVPMVRPEMGLSVVLSLFMLILLAGERRMEFMLSTGVFVILGALYFGLRYFYYGLPMPLPFYIKQGGFGLKGLADVRSYVVGIAILVPLAVSCFAFLFGPNWINRKRPCICLLAIFIAVGGQLAYYATIHQIMGFGYRYFQPIAVGIIVLAFSGSGFLYDFAFRSRLKESFSLPLLFCMLILLVFGGNLREYRPAHELFIDWYAKGNVPETLDVALGMQSAAAGKKFGMAIHDCGIIPFYSRFRTIDLAGLNNRAVALAGPSPEAGKKAAVNEIREHQPQLVILLTKEKHNPDALWGVEHLSHEDVTGLGYRYIGMMKEKRIMRSGDGYHLLVYADDDPEISTFLVELNRIGVLKLPSEAIESEGDVDRSGL